MNEPFVFLTVQLIVFLAGFRWTKDSVWFSLSQYCVWIRLSRDGAIARLIVSEEYNGITGTVWHRRAYGCAQGHVNARCVCVCVFVPLCSPSFQHQQSWAEGSSGIYVKARANLARHASVLLAGNPYTERQTGRKRDSLCLFITKYMLIITIFGSVLFCTQFIFLYYVLDWRGLFNWLNW